MSQPQTAFLTIVTRNYYWWAKTWAQSVREFHPESQVIIAFADDPNEKIIEHLSDFCCLSIPKIAEKMGIDNYARMAFQYAPFELTCALKPFVVRHLHQQFDNVVYLDADTLVYRPLSEIDLALQESDIAVTPHLLQPQTIERESRIRAAGTINGGFLATRKSATADSFLDWWANRCRFDCYVDPYSGHFVDQSWLDLASSFFDSFKLMRQESLNVAYWNLDQRTISECEGQFKINGQPLGFFHFSGFEPGKPNALSRFDNQVLSNSLLSLTSHYRNQLRSNQHSDLVQTQCEFANYSDGTEIDPYHREAIRGQFAPFLNVQNPFDLQSNPELRNAFEDFRPELILSRKQWQMEELQKEANKQTEWIHKRINRRLDRRVVSSLRSLYSLVSNTVFAKRRKPDDTPLDEPKNKAA